MIPKGIHHIPLTRLAANVAFANFGRNRRAGEPSSPHTSARAGGKLCRRCRVPCLAEEKLHIQSAAKDIAGKARHLLCQMVPVIRMVASQRFRYTAVLAPWADGERDQLHAVWLQIQQAARRLHYGNLHTCIPPGYPSAPLVFPSPRGGCAQCAGARTNGQTDLQAHCCCARSTPDSGPDSVSGTDFQTYCCGVRPVPAARLAPRPMNGVPDSLLPRTAGSCDPTGATTEGLTCCSCGRPALAARRRTVPGLLLLHSAVPRRLEGDRARFTTK